MNNFVMTLVLVGMSLSDRIAGTDIEAVEAMKA